MTKSTPILDPNTDDILLDAEHEATAQPVVIVNADDWGRTVEVTDRTLDCLLHRVVSSVSAMVFMEDSERAAQLAKSNSVDAGLHLNLTTAFTCPTCPSRVGERQARIARFLRTSRLAQLIYHPGLTQDFDYVVKAQLEEFERLYGGPARRIDGHHHMHLCINVEFQKLLPQGSTIRRNFSFRRSEKGWTQVFYRTWQDSRLAARHRMTDYFFSLPPMEPSRLRRIFALAASSVVELETHPVNAEEYRFLLHQTYLEYSGQVGIARGYLLRPQPQSWTPQA